MYSQATDDLSNCCRKSIKFIEQPDVAPSDNTKEGPQTRRPLLFTKSKHLLLLSLLLFAEFLPP